MQIIVSRLLLGSKQALHLTRLAPLQMDGTGPGVTQEDFFKSFYARLFTPQWPALCRELMEDCANESYTLRPEGLMHLNLRTLDGDHYFKLFR